jgi:hypothetical protein
MDTIWTKSKWTKDQLDHQPVESRVHTDRGVEHGIGEFLVRQNPEGLLAIEVVVDRQGANWAEKIQTRYYPKQEGIFQIERHPDESVAAFRLFDLSPLQSTASANAH